MHRWRKAPSGQQVAVNGPQPITRPISDERCRISDQRFLHDLLTTFAGTMPALCNRNERNMLPLVLLLPALFKLFLLSPVELFEVHTIAKEWLATGMFRYHHLGVWHASYQFPVYPAIVALMLWSGVGEVGVLVFQVVCGTASAWLVHRLAHVVFSGRSSAGAVALMAAFLTGASPFLAVYQVRMIHPFAWDMLLALVLLLSSYTVSPERIGRMMLLAPLAGIAILNRPTLLVFLLPAAWRCRSHPFSVRYLMAVPVLMALLLAPTGAWVLRNGVLDGHFTLSSATGQNLWIGIQRNTQGTAQLPDGRNYIALLSREDRSALSATDAHGQSGFFIDKWSEELRAEPGLWWRMMGVKLRNFWLFRGNLGSHRPDPERWALAAFKVYTVVLLPLLFLAWRDERMRLLLVTLFMFSLAQALFYVETRHRLLVEPVLLIVALGVMSSRTFHRCTAWTISGRVWRQARR